MDARTVKTKIWEDDWFQSLSDDAQKLFLYCITNNKIGFTGIFEVSTFTLQLQTRLKDGRLKKAKSELHDKVLFYKDWIYVKNSHKHNAFKGDSSDKAKEKEKSKIPTDVLECFINNNITPPPEVVLSGGNPPPDPSTSTSTSTSLLISNKERGVGENQEIVDHPVEVKDSKVDIPTYLKNIPEEDLIEFNQKFEVEIDQIKEKGEDMWYWYTGLSVARKKNYANPKSILRNALKKDFGKRSTAIKSKESNDLIQILTSNFKGRPND